MKRLFFACVALFAGVSMAKPKSPTPVAEVKTSATGAFAVTCEKPRGWTFRLRAAPKGD